MGSGSLRTSEGGFDSLGALWRSFSFILGIIGMVGVLW